MCDFFWQCVDNAMNLVQNKAVLAADNDEIDPTFEQIRLKICVFVIRSHSHLHCDKAIFGLQEDIHALAIAIAFNDGGEFWESLRDLVLVQRVFKTSAFSHELVGVHAEHFMGERPERGEP